MKIRVLFLVVAAVTGLGGYWLGRQHAASTPHHPDSTDAAQVASGETTKESSTSIQGTASDEVSAAETDTAPSLDALKEQLLTMKSIQWQDKGLQDFFASIRMLSPTQAAELLKFVDANAAKPVRDPLRYQLLNKFAEGDPDAALAYANGLSSGNAKRMAVSSVISTWAQENPSAALNWVQNLPEGQTRTEALSQLAGQWSRDDPEAAITFAIESLPAGQSRDQFLATLPEDAARQKSIRRYMDNLYRDKPAAAAEWAVALTDENQRNVYIEKIANMWRRSDLAGTRAWIVTTPLPADRQQKYLGD